MGSKTLVNRLRRRDGVLAGLAMLALAGGFKFAHAQELTLIHFSSYKAATDDAIAAFEAANPGVKIRASYVGEPQSVRAQFTTGNAPDITLTYPGDGTAMAVHQLGKAGLLEDLSDAAWTKSVSPTFRRAISYGGKVYAVPVGYSYIAMYSNDAVLKSVGATIPTNFNELLAFCDKAKATTIPIAFGLKENIPTLFPGYAMIASTTFVDNPNFAEDHAAGKTNFAKGYRQSMEMYLQMRDRGCFSRTAAGNSNDDALKQLANGQAALYVGVVNYVATLTKYNPDAKITQSPFPGNTDASKVRVPIGPTLSYGVSSQSKHKDIAKKFLAYLAQPEANRKWAATSAQLPAADIDSTPVTPGNSMAIAAALKERKTVGYLDRAWPNSKVQPAYMAGIQELLSNQTSIDALLKRLDDAYAAQ